MYRGRIEGNIMNFTEKVFKECAKIPKGKLSTYSRIAMAIGSPRAFRAVGNALNKNRSDKVPCHRVVCSSGKVGGFVYGKFKKIQILKNEGIKINGDKVKNLEKILFKF